MNDNGLPVHCAKEAQRVRRHRAMRGSREGTGPEPSRGPRVAQLAASRSHHRPAVHIGQDARSADKISICLNFPS